MNLEEQYHAEGMLRKIERVEAERDNAWTELREIRAAISANPEESTLDEVVNLRQQLATFHSAVEHVTEDGCTRRSFVAMPEGWAMVHKDRLNDLELAEEQLAAAQDEALEQARIVGMGGEREIDLRQKLDIVSSLLREASGRMSYGHWSSAFRARVEAALKTKEPKEQVTNTRRRNADDMGNPPANAAELLNAWKPKP